MRFTLEQRLPAPLDAVERALVDPRFVTRLAELPAFAAVEVLVRDDDGDEVRQQVRYTYGGDVPAVARPFVDPGRASWVEHLVLDRRAHAATFRLVPDHYQSIFRCHGQWSLEPVGGGAGTRRAITGELTVSLPLVGRRAERALVADLSRHQDEEAALLRRWLAGETGETGG